MDWVNIILTAFSMSVDAMTVNITNGIQEKNMKFSKMVLISLTFGIFQFVMPLIGYFIGYSFKDVLERYISWIAFGLLTALGVKSLIDWIKERKEAEKEEKHEIESKVISPFTVFVQGIATSIDALCIGFVYIGLSIPQALLVFAIIGITTFTLSLICVVLAKKVAGKLDKWAGLIASLVFIALGIKILLEGLLG